MRTSITFLLVAVLAFLALHPESGFGQGGADSNALANQSLRGYTHMFLAYAIAWVVLVGWVISIARRLGRVEKALKD
jgi:CcmD family protein